MKSPLPGVLEERIERASGEPGYRAYLEVREHVLRMLEVERAAGARRDFGDWQAAAAEVEYVLDAGPLVIEGLHRHAGPFSDLRSEDYRAGAEWLCHELAARRKALISAAGGSELLVPAAPELGGIGFEIAGALHNSATLDCFETLIALDRGAVLAPAAEQPPAGRVVWEIAAGTGEFTRAFKTIFPDTTCILSDLPELLLFSATTLKVAFPDAEFAFLDGAEDAVPPPDADFVFAPLSAAERLRPARLDLAVNTGSFARLPGAEAERFVAHAYALDCPFVYARDSGTPFQTYERRYWPHPIKVVQDGHRHLLGWWSKTPR